MAKQTVITRIPSPIFAMDTGSYLGPQLRIKAMRCRAVQCRTLPDWPGPVCIPIMMVDDIGIRFCVLSSGVTVVGISILRMPPITGQGYPDIDQPGALPYLTVASACKIASEQQRANSI